MDSSIDRSEMGLQGWLSYLPEISFYRVGCLLVLKEQTNKIAIRVDQTHLLKWKV